MKPLTILIFSLIILFCTSCKKKSADYFATTIELIILNQQGQNLLASPAVYTNDNIELFYVVNGQSQPYVGYGTRPTKGFLFNNDNNLPRIRIDLNFDKNVANPLTLVKFGNTKIDTLKAKFNYNDDGAVLESVWFNGVQKDIKGFTIIK